MSNSANTVDIFKTSFGLAEPLRKGTRFLTEEDGARYLAMAVYLNPKMWGNTYCFTTVNGSQVLAAAGDKDWVFVAYEHGDTIIRPAYLGHAYHDSYIDSGLTQVGHVSERIEVMLAEAIAAGLPVHEMIKLLDAFRFDKKPTVATWKKKLDEMYSLLGAITSDFDEGNEFYIHPSMDDGRF